MIFSEEAHKLYVAAPREIERVREAISSRPVTPIEEIELARANLLATVDRMMVHGWIVDDTTVDLNAPASGWDKFNRSLAFHLHAWAPVSYILKAYSDSADERYFLNSLRIAMSWMDNFQAKHLTLPLDDAVCALVPNNESTKAWYDMAVGMRAYMIAYLLDVIAHGAGTGGYKAEFDALFRALIFHQELLCQPGIFRAHNNHGLYQALGQLAAAKRFKTVAGFEVYSCLAEERLKAIVERSFFPSGVHTEHSPQYHYMILKSLMGAVEAKLIGDEGLSALLLRAQDALPWMIQPNETLVPIGDTEPGKFSRLVVPFDAGELEGLSSGESPGTTARNGVAAYYDAGYVFAKIQHPPSPKSATYFAQIAGFHSRTHKHADHLSFVWTEGEMEILVDAGKYGYAGKTKLGDEFFNQGFYYADPKRMYVEKTRAHNTVEIDDTDFARKGVKPFGSALKYAAEQNGLVVTSCEMRPLRFVRHQRTIVLKPAQFVMVWDWLIDREGAEHKFRQWFHLSPRWTAERNDRDYFATNIADGTSRVLSVASCFPDVEPTEVFCGATSPTLQGWISDRPMTLNPAPAFAFEADGVSAVRFGSLISLSSSIAIERVKANGSLRDASVEWRDDFGRHRLRLLRDADCRVSTDYAME